MKQIHKISNKGNIKNKDASCKGLKIGNSAMYLGSEKMAINEGKILDHTLVDPKNGKPKFLRRNDLIK